MEVCFYCGKEAKFLAPRSKKWRCCEKVAQCPGMKEKYTTGLKLAYKEGRKLPLAMHPAAKWNLGKSLFNDEDIFKENSSISPATIKKRFKNLVPLLCSSCGLSDWLGKPITLEVDHIDGNSKNNQLDNLRLLCLNCHSQTDTFRGRNINGLCKVTDEQMTEALKTTKCIREALLLLGLAPKGGNYKRAKKLIENMAPMVE